MTNLTLTKKKNFGRKPRLYKGGANIGYEIELFKKDYNNIMPFNIEPWVKHYTFNKYYFNIRKEGNPIQEKKLPYQVIPTNVSKALENIIIKIIHLNQLLNGHIQPITPEGIEVDKYINNTNDPKDYFESLKIISEANILPFKIDINSNFINNFVYYMYKIGQHSKEYALLMKTQNKQKINIKEKKKYINDLSTLMFSMFVRKGINIYDNDNNNDNIYSETWICAVLEIFILIIKLFVLLYYDDINVGTLFFEHNDLKTYLFGETFVVSINNLKYAFNEFKYNEEEQKRDITKNYDNMIKMFYGENNKLCLNLENNLAKKTQIPSLFPIRILKDKPATELNKNFGTYLLTKKLSKEVSNDTDTDTDTKKRLFKILAFLLSKEIYNKYTEKLLKLLQKLLTEEEFNKTEVKFDKRLNRLNTVNTKATYDNKKSLKLKCNMQEVISEFDKKDITLFEDIRKLVDTQQNN